MPEWPLLDAPGLHRTAGATLATSLGTTVTCGVANTKGAYAQLIASTVQDAHFITIYIGGGSAAASYLVDIAVGAAASERVLMPNLISQPSHVTQNGYVYQIPIFIPAGTRISARAQSSAVSPTLTVCATLGDYAFTGMQTLGVIEAWGPNTGTSQSVQIDPGATINTKGAYGQLIASTAFPVRMIVLAFGHIGTTTTVTRFWFLDIAVGAAASERIIIENVHVQNEATGDMMDPTTLWFPVSIPAGTRVAARCQCQDAAATARLLNLAIYGIG